MHHMDTEKKRCGLCGLWLHMKMFSPDTRTSDGLSTYCVDCQFLMADTDEIMNPLQPHLADKVFCLRCQEFKDRDQFSPDKRRKSGLYQWCRKCWSTYVKDKRYARSKLPTLQQAIRGWITVKYGDGATPLSVVRGGHTDVIESLMKLHPYMDPARLNRVFYDMCVEEAQPK